MRYEEWEPFYFKILEEFGFSKEEDIKVAGILNTHLKKPDLAGVNEKVCKKEVAVFGAGPSLDSIQDIPEVTTIASDGVTSFFIDMGVNPDIIVTDLDGDIDDIIKANRKGSIVFLHAHGDNKDKIIKYADRFENPFVTTQTRPFGNLLNFGGFTDGDRAVYIAEHFGPSKIILYGMDFKNEPGKYSYSKDSDIKRRKLKWAELLIKHLMETTQVPIVYFNED
ncbi:MAG: 6-hydroxymethylpterin diphosphokinase MptE-like protein [Candidatus Hydrothermarchaeales archaeon]